MKIYIVLNDGYPIGMASARRTATYVKGFSSLGFETEVIIPLAKENYTSKPLNSEASGCFNGGVYRYITGTSVRSKYFLLRRINDLKGYLMTLLFIVNNIKHEDKIIIYRGGWFWYFITSFIAKIKNVKIFMELNELPYVSSYVRFEKIKKFFTYKLAFPQFDGFIVISETLRGIAEKYKSKKARIIKVPIVVIPEDFEAEKSETQFPYIFHAGTLSEQKDGVVGMLEAFAIALKGKGFSAVITINFIVRFGVIAHGFGDFFNLYLGANGQEKALRNASFYVGGSMMLFNLVFIPKWGETGAAYAKFITGFVYLLIIIIYYRKFINNNK